MASMSFGRLEFVLTSAFLIVAIGLGGGVDEFPIGSMISQLMGLLVLGLLLLRYDWQQFWRVAKPEMAFLLAIIAVPLLQLIPLPPSIWRSLPERHPVVQFSDLLGFEPSWRPISLDSEATIYSALALIPAVAAFLAALMASSHQRRLLAGLVVATLMISGMLGIFQAAGAADSFYENSHTTYSTGLFANRNHQALALVVGLVLAAGLAAKETRAPALVVTALSLLLLLFFASGVMATKSRMGFALLAVAILFSLSFAARLGSRSRLTRTLAYLAPVGVLLAWALASHPSAGRLSERLSQTGDTRFEIWPTAADIAAAYFPVGSGLGTFNLAYEQAEDFELLAPGWVTSAHNEYLQISIETGLPGILLIAVFIALLSKWFRQPSAAAELTIKRAALLSIVLIMIHSAVDYPLRTISLLTIFAFLCGMATAARRTGDAGAEEAEQPAISDRKYRYIGW
jgi:O-antigen ligase